MSDEEFFRGNLEIRKALIQALETKTPILIGRTSIGAEAEICLDFVKRQFPQLHLHQLVNNSGIFVKTQEDIREYVTAMMRSFQHSTLIGIWDRPGWAAQDFLVSISKKPTVQAQALEPFYFLDRGPGHNWMEPLKGKSVLIISPFAKTFQEQLDRAAQPFGSEWFKGTSFSFCKPPLTLAGNHQEVVWQDRMKEFKERLVKQIADKKPDVCLASCGGYGMPICDFLVQELGVSAIYVGGALQLFFGVMGSRWTTNETIQMYVKANPSAWIRPSEEERPPNLQRVEGGCYW
jgi:hypothetical protein